MSLLLLARGICILFIVLTILMGLLVLELNQVFIHALLRWHISFQCLDYNTASILIEVNELRSTEGSFRDAID